MEGPSKLNLVPLAVQDQLLDEARARHQPALRWTPEQRKLLGLGFAARQQQARRRRKQQQAFAKALAATLPPADWPPREPVK